MGPTRLSRGGPKKKKSVYSNSYPIKQFQSNVLHYVLFFRIKKHPLSFSDSEKMRQLNPPDRTISVSKICLINSL